ncbi:MAG TPA: phosphatidate cytidylyltransferase [Candidatus Saccharimonadia bacterium]|nr:phosphatidate cytidylyltransferase [Candidatus Saccharimonadia bacterium]
MLKQRVLTALILAPVVVAAVLLLDTPMFALCLGVIFAVGLLEWSRLIGMRLIYVRLALVAVAVAIMGLAWQYREQGALIVALVCGAAWWMLAPLWLSNVSFASQPRKRWLSIKAAAGLLAVIPAWAAALLLHATPERGPWWLLFVVLLVWGADIGAYFAGRKFGRTKLAPSISPGKTVAGVYGALVVSALFSLFAGWWLDSTGWALATFVVLSLVTVLFSIVGDLFESLIKRHSNLKDSGSILPGHGGVFDRLDSLFAALPVFTAGKLLAGL